MDQIQALIDILKDTPEMALWGIGIFLSWKLLTMGSIVGSIAFVCKLFINRYFDNKESHIVRSAELEIESKQLDLQREETKIQQTHLNNRLRLFDRSCIINTEESLVEMLGLMKSTTYIHESDIRRVIKLIEDDNNK